MSDMVPLGKLISLQRGTTYKSASIGEPGPVLLGLGAIERNGGFRDGDLRTYGGDSPSNLLVRPGDLFLSLKDVTQSADLLGSVARVPSNIELGRLTQDTVRLDILTGEVSSSYLYWMLRTPQYRSHCRMHATGTTNLGLSREDFLSFDIPCPTAERQQLVELLDALDNKVAANMQLSRTAIELADAEFTVALCRADLSEMTFADIASVRGGGTPRSDVAEYWEGAINWATPTDVTRLPGPYLETTAKRITDSGLDACASALYPPGSILMTSRATIGAFAVAQIPTAVNQGFIVVNPHDLGLRWWLYHEMRSRVDEFLSLANGATFLELSRGNFKKFRVRMAADSVVREFSTLADALHSCARTALVENNMLATTRDELLPELMSGKIRVRDAEKRVEEVL